MSARAAGARGGTADHGTPTDTSAKTSSELFAHTAQRACEELDRDLLSGDGPPSHRTQVLNVHLSGLPQHH